MAIPSPTTVLFLCTGNSCRSQMAEGWARALVGNRIEPYSAGSEVLGLDERAVEVMAEAGIDISGQHSKTVDEVSDIPFDYVVTVCNRARESCPLFPGPVKIVHVDFQDPAQAAGSEEEIMQVFRQIRDEIRDFVRALPEGLQHNQVEGHFS